MRIRGRRILLAGAAGAGTGVANEQALDALLVGALPGTWRRLSNRRPPVAKGAALLLGVIASLWLEGLMKDASVWLR